MADKILKLKIIPEWKKAWKLLSVQMSALGIVVTVVVEYLNSIWYSLPPSLLEKIPHSSTVSLAFLVLTLVVRLIKQKRKPVDGTE